MESQSGSTLSTLDNLISVLSASERRLSNAAEQIRNRGLKLVLKTYAQQRASFMRQLQALSSAAPPTTTSQPAPAGSAVYRGWVNIKAALTIRRRLRHRLVLQEVLAGEAQTIEQYKTALTTALPPETQKMVEQQYSQILTIRERLAAMATGHDGRLVVRLFDNVHEAEQAVDRLKQAEFSAADIYTTSIANIGIDETINERRSGWRETVLTGSLLGLLCGAGTGLLMSLAQRFYFPEWQNFLIPTALGSLFELPLLGGLIGAFFGFIFSLLMGIDAKEDDDYLSEESLRKGDTLVAVFTQGSNITKAEQIIGLKHGFEVKPATA